jgi:hypothetical protein
MNSDLPAAPPNMTLRYGSVPPVAASALICGMFTPSYRELAERLVRSLRAFELPHAIFEVPAVHDSISLKGSADPVYTKANFIWHVLERTACPVLYLDVDCVVTRPPELIGRIAAAGHDFAIFNWLAQEQNDAYVPAPVPEAPGEPPAAPRYYQPSYHVDYATEQQLLCSGAAQFWRKTPAAVGLLGAWFATIRAQPRVADDECLDFAFNNPSGDWRTALRPFWLPKAYARYPWWIFDEPVIDHPDIPFQGDGRAALRDEAGRKHYYPERAAARKEAPFIPRDCVIDTKTGDILRRQAEQLVPTGERWTKGIWPLTQPLPW